MNDKVRQKLRLLIFFISAFTILIIWFKSDIKSLQSFDAYDKLHQSYSLLYNNFKSETLAYSGTDFDADHRFSFVSDVTMIKLPDGRIVSAFPIGFAIVGLPFIYLNQFIHGAIHYSPLVSLLPLIVIWWLLLRFKFHPIIFLVGLWGNFLWLQTFLYAEYLLSTLLVFIGILPFLKNNVETTSYHDQRNSFLAGLSMASAVWFRHEALIYGGILIGSMAIILYLKRRFEPSHKDTKPLTKILGFFSVGFIFMISLWMIVNWFDYGNILGPRYIANKATQLVNFATTVKQVWSLLISDPLYRLGFFAFMPLTLIPFIARAFQKQESVSIIEDTLLLSTGLFLIGMSIIAPNSGFSGVGPRYLMYAVIPSYLLTGWWFQRITSKFWRVCVLMISLLTCLLPFVTYKLQNLAASYHLTARNEIENSKTDIFVFSNADLYYVSGPQLIGKESYLARNQQDFNQLLTLLQINRKHKSVSFIQVSDYFTQQATTNSIDVAAWQENLDTQIKAGQWPPHALQNLKQAKVVKGKYVDIYQIDL